MRSLDAATVAAGVLLLAQGASLASAATAVVLSVSNSEDDAEESGGIVNLVSPDLDMPWSNAGQPSVSGIIFRDAGIPQGSKLAKAVLTFTCRATSQGGEARLELRGTPDGRPFKVAPNDLTSRPPTEKAVLWTKIPPWQANGAYATPDLSAVLQELVDGDSWNERSSIALLIANGGNAEPAQGNQARSAYTFDADAAKVASLSIEFEPPAAPSSQPSQSPSSLQVEPPSPSSSQQPSQSSDSGGQGEDEGLSLLGPILGGVFGSSFAAFAAFGVWRMYRKRQQAAADDDSDFDDFEISEVKAVKKLTNHTSTKLDLDSLVSPQTDSLKI